MRRVPLLVAVLSSMWPLIDGLAEPPPNNTHLDREKEADFRDDHIASWRSQRRDCDDHEKKGTTLYIWAGDQFRLADDFVAVIDFDENSKTYGKVMKTVPVPASAGNEAHHMHL